MATTAEAILERSFLEMRAKLIDLADVFDRMDRAVNAGRIENDDRLRLLHQAAAIMNDDKPDRVARIQMLFSDPYDPDWQRPGQDS